MGNVLHKHLNVPYREILSAQLAIEHHRKRYSVDVPYKWKEHESWTNRPVSNMKHCTTPSAEQRYPEMTFENIMIPYVYPVIDDWIQEHMSDWVGVPYHTRSIWYMIYSSDTLTPPHDHRGQGKKTLGDNGKECCSGVFYLKASGNSERSFVIHNDEEHVVFNPRTSDLILFPIDTLHSAWQKGSNGSSLAIAFNVLFYER